MAAMKDGFQRTIMCATVDRSRSIPWTKPEDIVVGPDGLSVGTPDGIGTPLASGDDRAGIVVMADMSLRVVTGTFDRDTLAALVSRDGGEDVDGGGQIHEELAASRDGPHAVTMVEDGAGAWRLLVE